VITLENRFNEEVDAWIKGFRQELKEYSSELDRCSDSTASHDEEIRFNYEYICHVERRIDVMESTMERILSILNSKPQNIPANSPDKISMVNRIKPKM